MKLYVEQSSVLPAGEVQVELPLSKSISNRLLIINALAGQETDKDLVAVCDDTRAMLDALSTVGDCDVNVGAAGTAMRFLTAYFAGCPDRTVTLDGSERMRQRPIGPLVDALRLLGADIRYLGKPGYPPLLIRGRQLEGGGVSIDAGVSSQYISALLMSGPAMKLGLELMLKGDIVSRPYIDMTLRMMEQRGADVTEHDLGYGAYEIRLAPRLYKIDRECEPVEADWSAALYWYEVSALTSRSIMMPCLHRGSLQGDSMVKSIFEELGVITEFQPHGGVKVFKTQKDNGGPLEVDMTECPDAAQTVAATCCGLGRRFVITGLSTLPLKETDRLGAMKTELRRLGYDIDIRDGNKLVWDGGRCEKEAVPVIETYHDHRMAMSIAPLAAVAGGLYIDNPEVVSKSYPDFWDNLVKAGYCITVSKEEVQL